LAPQALEQALLIFFPKVRDNFSVTVSDEPMPARLELCSFFEMVEELAIEHYRYSSIFVGDRLLAIG
jgi:hypothetical protein